MMDTAERTARAWQRHRVPQMALSPSTFSSWSVLVQTMLCLLFTVQTSLVWLNVKYIRKKNLLSDNFYSPGGFPPISWHFEAGEPLNYLQITFTDICSVSHRPRWSPVSWILILAAEVRDIVVVSPVQPTVLGVQCPLMYTLLYTQ